jgi:hypothetical protein
MKGYNSRRKTKTQKFYREIKTPNRVLKTENTACFSPTPVLQIVMKSKTCTWHFVWQKTSDLKTRCVCGEWRKQPPVGSKVSGVSI